jgi:Fibronectin type III domain
VHIDIPAEDGGTGIIYYQIQYDTVSTFTSASLQNDTACYGPPVVGTPINCQPLEPLYLNGPLVHHITGLTAGVPYYIRVLAHNSDGPSAASVGVNNPITATQLAAAVPAVSAQLRAFPLTQLQTNATVTWAAPTDTGGAPVSGYRVEWWEADSVVHEQQQIKTTWATGDAPTSSFLMLFKGASIYAGFLTGNSEVMTRDALMNMKDASVAVPALPAAIPALLPLALPMGAVNVNKTDLLNGQGFTYLVTFLDDTLNPGNQPMITTNCVGLKTGAFSQQCDVVQVASGVRAGGSPEVQVITATGTRQPRGLWSASFAGSNFTAYLSATATAAQVQTLTSATALLLLF